MKNVLLRKVLASVLTATTIITFIPIKASATWTKDYLGNWNWMENGHNAIGWKNINGNWYYFDYSGVMRTGWINDWGYWYYADSNGVMQNGIVEIDGKIYAFDDRGIMQKGNVSINGQSYKFNNQGYAIGDKIPAPIKTFDNGNNLLPYGSKPAYSNSGDSSSDSDSEDEIFKDVETIKVRYKVTFNTDGGSSVSAITNIKSGKTIDLPKEPTKDGYKFDGWYKDDDFDKEFTEDTKIRSNMKVYAKWIKEGSSDNSSSGDSSSSNSNSVIVNNVQVTVGENESDIGNVKVSAKATNYAGLTEATIDLIDKKTDEVKKTQNLNIGGSGYIKFTFTGIEKGTYYAKVTVGKVNSNSSEFIILSKDEVASSDVIKDMNELRLQDISLVTDDLSLPTKGSHGSVITWKSSDSNIIDATTGKVNRINGAGTEVVKLTATISKGNSTPVTKDFNAYVKKFDMKLGEAVEKINSASKAGTNEEEKILSIKNQLTTSCMVSIGVNESQYNKYNELNLSSKPDKEQTYQLEVAKSIYDDLNSNNYISGNIDINNLTNVNKKELENEAMGIARMFDRAVTEQARLKKEKEDSEIQKEALEVKQKELKELIAKYQDEEDSGKLNSDKFTSLSWTNYKSAMEQAKNSLTSGYIASIENAIKTLSRSHENLVGAYLVTITLYRDGKAEENIWSEFEGDVSLQKGSSTPIKTDFAKNGARKVAVTSGEYKVLVDGRDTGKIVSVTDKPEDDVKLYYYTVSYSIVGSDSISGEVISAKYDGQDIKSGDILLGGKELVIRVKGISDVTNSFKYLWKDAASNEVSKISTYGEDKLENKINVKCEITPSDILIDNLIAIPDDSGNISFKSRIINSESNKATIELLELINLNESVKKTINDVELGSGYAEGKFTDVSTGIYKVKVTVNGISKTSDRIYIKNIDPKLKGAIDAINLARLNDEYDDTFTNTRTELENNKDYLELNFDGYGNLSDDKYKIEVAKAVYNAGKISAFAVDESGKARIKKAFNDALTIQLSVKEFDELKQKLTDAINNEYSDGKDRKTLKLISDKDTYESIIWNKYESAINNAIKVESSSIPNSTNSNISTLTTNINNEIKMLEDVKIALKSAVLQEAEIKINLDGKMKAGITSVKLEGLVSKSATETSTGFKVSVPDGTYKILINGSDTGETIVVSGSSKTHTINYYTVKFNVEASPSIKASILSTYDGKTISNGTSVIAKDGKEMLFKVTASSSNNEEITYSWKNTNNISGTSLGNEFKYSINNVSSPIDITCEVKPSENSVIETIKGYVSNNKKDSLTISKLEEAGLTELVETNLSSYKEAIAKLTTDSINKVKLQEIIKQVNSTSSAILIK
ncbi:InlB B-repeat-containing protein [Clostridium aquiflavi]|uniref:InlB B-repeat-containing protein n=1 Tax=Clostridium aquiflavi TaxID=3073603 RepID=A0ABU1EJ56_9CLOT|nr:InlB B-repeat-containing protein [Clostridium sp. 5N-1]MDR5588435.1 InlB B-repeat-containing protein [Clostridium sp. 5N-1]